MSKKTKTVSDILWQVYLVCRTSLTYSSSGFSACRSTSASSLYFKGGQIRKPRQYFKNLFVVLPKQFYIVRNFWRGPTKLISPPQNIEKLGKFVDLDLA